MKLTPTAALIAAALALSAPPAHAAGFDLREVVDTISNWGREVAQDLRDAVDRGRNGVPDPYAGDFTLGDRVRALDRQFLDPRSKMTLAEYENGLRALGREYGRIRRTVITKSGRPLPRPWKDDKVRGAGYDVWYDRDGNRHVERDPTRDAFRDRTNGSDRDNGSERPGSDGQ